MTEPTSPHDPQQTRDEPHRDGLDAGRPVGADTDLAPMHVPMLRIIEVGILVWAAALVVTLLVPALHSGSRDWWPWTCVAGIVLGAMGWLYVRRGRGNARDA